MKRKNVFTAEDGKDFTGPDAENRCDAYERMNHVKHIRERLTGIIDSWIDLNMVSGGFSSEKFIRDIVSGRDLKEVYDLMVEVIATNKEK